MRKLLCSLFAGTAVFLGAATPDPASYEPDFSKSDIYLPHLKRTPLSGWWKLKKVSSDGRNDPNDEGTRNQYYAAEFDDSGWTRDIVPNDIHIPFLMKLPEVTDWNSMWAALPRDVREWAGVAWFRKEFTAPGIGKNERAILTFGEVLGDFTLYVNGKKIGEGAPFTPATDYRGLPRMPQSFDITDAVLPGKKNTIALRLFHNGHPIRWGWAGMAGITDLVYLDVRPAAYAENILVTPRKNLRDVDFECILSGSGKSADTDNWTGEIFEWNSGKKAADVTFGKRYAEDGLNRVSGTASMKNPKLWSCESPFLYGIRIRNARGELTGVQRFGMRTFGVKDGNFVLNGKAVALRGLTVEGMTVPLRSHAWLHVLRLNVGDFNRRYWQALSREANVNHARLHSATMPRGYYDILDEFGVIVTDELAYPETAIKNPTRSDMIAVKGFDGACDKQGNMLPEFVRKTKERIRNNYSHPSICTYSFGNEIRQYDDPRVEKLLNSLYDLYHKVDKQQRPTTNSSGRFWKDGTNVKELREREKLDYVDTHDYTGSINNFPLAYCEPVAKHFIETVRKYYGKEMPPIVNGEVVYMMNHYYPEIFDGIWKNENDPQPDWDKLLYMLNQWRKDSNHSFLSHYWVRNWGSKNYKYKRALGRGIYTERILEAYRKCWPEYDGYENLCEPYFTLSNAWPFDRIKLIKNEAFPYLARVNSPVIAILDYVAPNRFANEPLATRLHAINNSESDLGDVRFEAVIEQNGKAVSEKTLPVGALASNATKILPLELTMPPAPGEYRLVYRLTSGGKVLSDRSQELRIRSRAETFRPVKTAKKIALYDASAVFGGLKPYSTVKTLKAFGIPFRPVRSFEKLNDFDVLIIGAESLDGRIQENAEQIRAFVENGGRLLIFDQNFIGRIPFLPELEYVLAGPGQFSEIVRFDHPAMRGLTQKDFFCWNQKDWSVYRTYISPVSRAAIMTGGESTQWGADHFGMISAHLKLGKGDILMCQAEVTKTLKDDSSAAQFSRQLLETVLDDKTRADAQEFTGLPLPKNKPLAKSKAFPVSLRSASNMGFTDPVARDGKGGWTDQGPQNDLSPFPVGERIFGGVPFDIINPDSNGGRSCIVQSNNPNLKFQPESKPIKVNAKLKRLLFLHSGGWIDESKKEELGEYTVTYDSGRKVRIPLIGGDNIGDWWNTVAPKKHADSVWSGMNKSGVVGVYLFEWVNPYPNDTIRNIVLTIRNNAVVGLVGLTGEK